MAKLLLSEFKPLLPETIEKYKLSISELFLKIRKSIAQQSDRDILQERVKNLNQQIREFVADFPDSERLSDIKEVAATRADKRAELLAAVEDAYVKATDANPTSQKVETYLKEFPDHKRLEEVHAAAKSKPDVFAKVQPQLEEAYLKKLEPELTPAKADEFLEKFPEPVQKEKFEKILEQKPAVKKEVLSKMKKLEAAKKLRESKQNPQ